MRSKFVETLNIYLDKISACGGRCKTATISIVK